MKKLTRAMSGLITAIFAVRLAVTIFIQWYTNTCASFARIFRNSTGDYNCNCELHKEKPATAENPFAR